MKKVTANLEKKIDKFINEECGGWEPKDQSARRIQYIKDVVSGKIILSDSSKEAFKANQKSRRDLEKFYKDNKIRK